VTRISVPNRKTIPTRGFGKLLIGKSDDKDFVAMLEIINVLAILPLSRLISTS
jgi:hypothetical protein